MSPYDPIRPSTRSPGQIALSVMGWQELSISVILFAQRIAQVLGGG